MWKSRLVTQSDFLRRAAFSKPQLALVSELGLALHNGLGVAANNRGEIVVERRSNEDQSNECERTEEPSGPAARSWEGRQGSQAASDSAYALFGPRRCHFESQLTEVRQHYPETRFASDKAGLWFRVPVYPLGGQSPRATILCCVPDDRRARITSWAYWDERSQIAWVGPRHTNYPDGAVCAFPLIGYWTDQNGLVSYFDRVCEWLVRQLFLKFEKYWPGPQEGPMGAYYRISEGLPQELCFCGSNKLYYSCCRGVDLLTDQTRERLAFLGKSSQTDIGKQKPPKLITRFLQGPRLNYPLISDVHPDQMLYA